LNLSYNADIIIILNGRGRDFMKILAFDIGGTNIKYAICNENFQLSDKHTIPTEAKNGGQYIINKVSVTFNKSLILFFLYIIIDESSTMI